jgi:nicotinamide-nucleotide amidase
VFLRYFNAAGATEKFGEDHDPETHLIPNVLRVALGQSEKVMVFGDDYETPDGTCIRDYIHIVDLAQAHILALEKDVSGPFNLGNGGGYSVKQVIDVAERGHRQEDPRRHGPAPSRRSAPPDRQRREGAQGAGLEAEISRSADHHGARLEMACPSSARLRKMKPGVELVSTGLELLTGRTVNTHAHTLARHLAPLGLRLLRDTTVPDDREVIRQAVAEALQRVDLVVVSGGLGPTSDDLTREAVADLAGVGLVMHEPSRQAICDRYARTGRVLNDSVERHALVLEGAEVMMNPVGLAPGEDIRFQDQRIFLLPGPPHEFEAILAEHLVPRLAGLAPAPPQEMRMFQICGMGESDLISRLGGNDFPGAGLEVAYCASIGRVEVRLWGPPEKREELDRVAGQLRAVAGPCLYAERPIAAGGGGGRTAARRQLTLATAESCTGGLVSHRLTNIAGSSAWFRGGVVAYANEAKVRDLGVSGDHAANGRRGERAVARQMAEGVRARFGTDLGLGITGIAGPGGGTAQKPVGLVYCAVADARGTDVGSTGSPDGAPSSRTGAPRWRSTWCGAALAGLAP